MFQSVAVSMQVESVRSCFFARAKCLFSPRRHGRRPSCVCCQYLAVKKAEDDDQQIAIASMLKWHFQHVSLPAPHPLWRSHRQVSDNSKWEVCAPWESRCSICSLLSCQINYFCLKSPICGAVLTLKNLNYKQCLNLFLRRKSADIKKAELALRSRDHIADHCRNDR